MVEGTVRLEICTRPCTQLHQSLTTVFTRKWSKLHSYYTWESSYGNKYSLSVCVWCLWWLWWQLHCQWQGSSLCLPSLHSAGEEKHIHTHLSYTTYMKVCHKIFAWLGRQQMKEGRLDCGVNLIISHLYVYRVGTAIEFLSTEVRVAVSLTLCSLCVWEMR